MNAYSSDSVLCPGCCRPNAAASHFCTACGAPLSWHASTDPIGTVFAEGYAARRALTQSPKPIIVLGIWLWLLPIALVSLLGLGYGVHSIVNGFVEVDFQSVISGLLAGGVTSPCLWISGKILYTTTRNFVHGRQTD